MAQPFVSGVSYAILPSAFLAHWKMWVAKPLVTERPERIDNSLMLCEHGLLLIDPAAPEDFRDDAICVVEEKHWRMFAERFADDTY